MAKLAFTKLGLKLPTEVKTLEWNGQAIEIKQYLTLAEKLDIIGDIVNRSYDPNNNFYNPCQYEVIGNAVILEHYTNIAFTEKQKEDFHKVYDLLDSNGIFEKVFELIPVSEFNFIVDGVENVIKAVYEYNHSALGILDSVKQDYSNLDLNAAAIQEKLADPENIGLLKDVLAKLG